MDYREQIIHGNEGMPLAIYQITPEHIRYRMNIHWHPEHEILCVYKGTLHLRLNDTSYCLQKGDVVFIAGGMVHSAEPENCEYSCILVNLSLLMKKDDVCMKFANRLDEGKYEISPLLSDFSERFAVLSEQICKAYEDNGEGYAFEIKGYIFGFFAEILNRGLYSLHPHGQTPSKNISLKMKQTVSYIEKNYSTPIRLCELAATADMTPNHFCRCFKSFTGVTPFTYLINYRLSMAQYALKTTELSVTQIALDCGFNDVSYFINIFKKSYGMTPNIFRKTQK